MSSSSIAYVAAFCAAIAPGLNSVPILFKSGEIAIFPIVSNMSATELDRMNGKVRYTVSGEKNRACEFLKAEAYTRQDGVAMKAQLTFENDPTPNASRPKGEQSFGVWSFDLKNQPNAQEVFVITTHDCGLWNLQTQIGPWAINKGLT